MQMIRSHLRLNPVARVRPSILALALLAAALFLLAGCATEPGNRSLPHRILFIGNSYTYRNDIPMQIARMAENAGIEPVETAGITAGGAPLCEHVANPTTLPRIAEGWDAVVLQGKSTEPLTNPDGFLAAAQVLADAASAAGARVLFYETWARQEGSSVYDESWSGGDPQAMQHRIHEIYSAAANRFGGELIPVGTARAAFASRYPDIPLYDRDGSHPTPQASHFVACMLFVCLFDADPTALTWVPWGVAQDEAVRIRAAAKALAVTPVTAFTSALATAPPAHYEDRPWRPAGFLASMDSSLSTGE